MAGRQGSETGSWALTSLAASIKQGKQTGRSQGSLKAHAQKHTSCKATLLKLSQTVLPVGSQGFEYWSLIIQTTLKTLGLVSLCEPGILGIRVGLFLYQILNAIHPSHAPNTPVYGNTFREGAFHFPGILEFILWTRLALNSQTSIYLPNAGIKGVCPPPS